MNKRKVDKAEKMRRGLPYGKYIFSDGSQILFNRYYEPMQPHGSIPFSRPDKRIEGAKKQWFYKDSNPPWINKETLEKCKSILKAFEVL